MQYTITRQVTAKKRSPLYGFYRVLIVMIAIPVVAVALLSFVLLFVFSRIQALFAKRGHETPAEHYHLELPLLKNEFIEIMAVEDESDTELTLLNELWAEKVYHEETYLYRAETSPVIPLLHGKIICFYLKENSAGAFLQLPVIGEVQPVQLPATELVYLQYNDLEVSPIQHIGPFYLYNEDANEDIIKGFNENEELIIRLLKS